MRKLNKSRARRRLEVCRGATSGNFRPEPGPERNRQSAARLARARTQKRGLLLTRAPFATPCRSQTGHVQSRGVSRPPTFSGCHCNPKSCTIVLHAQRGGPRREGGNGSCIRRRALKAPSRCDAGQRSNWIIETRRNRRDVSLGSRSVRSIRGQLTSRVLTTRRGATCRLIPTN